jgi:uncharacterized glyoxalase superfamily protein PhnB
MTIQSINANLGVTNVAASVAFYTSLLGFKVTATVPDVAPYAFAMLQLEGVTIMLQEKGSLIEEYQSLQGQQPGGLFTLYVSVSGVDVWYEQLRGKVNIIKAPQTTFYGTKEFALQDLDGYILTFSEHV